METEEERRAGLEDVAATKRLRLAMETVEERKLRLEKMVATAQLMFALTKRCGQCGCGFVPKPILKIGNYAYHSNLMFNTIGTHN